jgi:tetratricopeptide (TPR) repeat protein
MRSSLLPLGEQLKLFERMREAELLAETLDDQQRLGQVSAYLSGYFIQAGNDPTRAIEKAQRALEISSSSGNFALQVQANHFLASAYHYLGDYDRALKQFRRNLNTLVGDLIYERFGLAFLPSVGTRYQLVLLLSDRGDFREAANHGDEAVRIAETANHPFSVSTAYYAVGHLYISQGAIDQAIGLLERNLEFCRLWNLHQNLQRVAAALGYAYAAAERVGEALPLLNLAKERFQLRPASAHAQLAQAYLLIGRREEADLIVSHALDIARSHAERGREVEALYVLGEVALSTIPVDIAKGQDHYRQAMALASEIGLRPLVAHCHVGLGKLYKRAERQQQSKEHLTTAITMMREMEMGLWLERAEAELKKLS